MTEFVDANIFIERWTNSKAEKYLDELGDNQCTSVLVLTEVFHKLNKKNISNAFQYLRQIMGVIEVYDITKNDLFNAMKNKIDININDKIHIEVMKRNNVVEIVSYDKDFDKDKIIIRKEP